MSLKLTIEFETPFHHGSGYGLAGIVDRGLLRDHEGMPVIGASALKGKFRAAAISIVLARGEPVCTVPGEPVCKGEGGPGAQGCLLCRVFGSVWQRGGAWFRDARPAEPAAGVLRIQLRDWQRRWLPGGSEIRASTAIDRERKRVVPQHLFSTETLPPSIPFESRIDGRLTEEGWTLLEQSARLIQFLGADSARGLGRCRILTAKE